MFSPANIILSLRSSSAAVYKVAEANIVFICCSIFIIILYTFITSLLIYL